MPIVLTSFFAFASFRCNMFEMETPYSFCVVSIFFQFV